LGFVDVVHDFRARKDAACRDAGCREGVVVRTAIKRDRLVGQPLAVPEVLEDLLDSARAVWSREAMLVAVAVIDQRCVVRRGQHVEVEHD